MSEPTVSADPAPSWLSDITSLIGSGAQAYQAVSGQKLSEQAAQVKPATANLSTTAQKPWYQQAWFLPAAIGAGILLFVTLFAGSRRG